MDTPADLLGRWKQSLPTSVTLAGVFARNPTAYKWKAPYRSWVLRETLFWRTYDQLTQAQLLHEHRHTLGSRLLLRGALESLAVLAHLNQSTQDLLAGEATFADFDMKTRVLLLGSRDQTTKYQSVNVLTILKHVDKSYPGVLKLYNTLSEAAHPNYEGVCFGYSEIDYERNETFFAVKLYEMWADRHDKLFSIVVMAFEHEYNDIWAPLQERLEGWLAEHDSELKVTAGDA